MNLISCDGCGTVLDKNKLNFPKDIYHDDYNYGIDSTKGVWDDIVETHVPFVKCPVCGIHVKDTK
jgi:hypothetical protein